MALKTDEFKVAYKQMLTDMRNVVEDPEASIEQISERFGDMLETYIKSADVTVASNIPVQTTGTAASQAGQTTAEGSGSLS